MDPVISLQSVTKSYRTESVETLALRGVELDVFPGDYVAITGASGGGKSTLLNILGLLDSPSTGKYILGGNDVSAFSFDQRARLRNKSIGFVFQSFHLLDELSVIENVRLPIRFAPDPADDVAERAGKLLERVGLGHRQHHKPSQLSGGQQQRVAIARALIMAPDVLLLDEPTGNLDAETSTEIMAMLDELNDGKTTIILVTHEAEFANRAKRIVVMRDGRALPFEAGTR
jgi:putative ABC transport system ATP-binding protein